jgi:glycosyltransferase involved in cell wall biosynthesis
MKVAAITTYPPSTLPQSSFAYHAIGRFLESPAIEQIVVLGEQAPGNSAPTVSERLLIDHCWEYNSHLTPIRLLRAVERHHPDVVWLNLQYTLFGSKPLPIFLGLMLPTLLKHKGYAMVVVLHNYLGAIDLTESGLGLRRSLRAVAPLSDRIVMRSLRRCDHVFVMVRQYAEHLSSVYNLHQVQCIEQDLYNVPPFQPIPTGPRSIVTIGYFGTYKKLELLLDSFEVFHQLLPDVRLRIVGRSHPQTPSYLEDLVQRYAHRLDNVDFLGYVPDQAIPGIMARAHVVIATNTVNTGNSAVVQYAAIYGRALVVPYTDLYRELQHGKWGVEYYTPGDTESLIRVLLGILMDEEKQNAFGLANYRHAACASDQFLGAHLRAFEALATT